MTMITGHKQGNHKISWEKYLHHIITIDKSINSVCLNLDEEGNDYFDMTVDEAKIFIAYLKNAVKQVEMKK
mgnify:CR=1 FL=1